MQSTAYSGRVIEISSFDSCDAQSGEEERHTNEGTRDLDVKHLEDGLRVEGGVDETCLVDW